MRLPRGCDSSLHETGIPHLEGCHFFYPEGMTTIRTRVAAVGVACALLIAAVGGSSEPTRARRGMVVASDGLAAAVGRDVLREGG